ncbi:MAG: hypothetical protein ACRDHP_11005, partial [Ktedonobacterales bacterium]
MPKSLPQPDPEDAHTDLMATLAASRELGPEMDKALAESYMQKHAAATPAPAPQNQSIVAPSRFDSADIASAIVMVAGIAAFVALLIFAGPQAWGLIWVFFIFGGWRFWGFGRRNAEYRARRAEWRQARNEVRADWHRDMRSDWYAMRRGDYRMGDPDRPGVPPLPTPTVPQVSAPPAPQAAPAPAPQPS